nr:WhiB family transcriptional regulator [Glycomyces arizonensis]
MDGRDYLADLLGNVPEWQARALCAQTDPEAFFPEKGGSTRDAKRICARCEVKENCLQYALEHDERFGIWGGLSERERRKIKRQAREAARRRAERAMPVVVCMPTPMINPELEPVLVEACDPAIDSDTLVAEPIPVGSVLVEQRAEPERERVPVAA